MIEERKEIIDEYHEKTEMEGLQFMIKDDTLLVFIAKYISGCILSILLPGMGHIIIQQYKKAALLFLLHFVFRFFYVVVLLFSGIAEKAHIVFAIPIWIVGFTLSVILVSITNDVLYDYLFLIRRLRAGYPICEEEFFVEPMLIFACFGNFSKRFITYAPVNAPKNWIKYNHDLENQMNP
jgi:hypothetical protein